MDIATIFGIFIGVLVVLIAVGGEAVGLYDGAALLLVAGGGFAATCIAFSPREIAAIFRLIKPVFFAKVAFPGELVDRMVRLAETARRRGILALESAANELDDRFLSTGLRLAVDGTEPKLIQPIMEREIHYLEQRHRLGQRVMRTLGHYWMIFGVVGALVELGLHAESAGAGIALVEQAALPLLYGALLAGLIGLPFASKLATYSEQEMLAKRMIVEGIISIQAGDHPRIIEHKLSVFLAPPMRPESEAEKGDQAPVPAPAGDEMGAEEIAEFVAQQEGWILRLIREAVAHRAAGPEQQAAVEEMVEKVARKEMTLVSLLAVLNQEIRQEILQPLINPPPPLIDRVYPTEGTFGFEDIGRLSDPEIQRLMREIDQRDLVLALKGARAEISEKFLSNMSERVRTFILEEISYLGPVKPAEVLMAQAQIVGQMLRLAAQGKITTTGD